jgi:hypothetical protein
MKFCCKLEKKKSYVYYNFIRPKETAHAILGWAVHWNDEIIRNVKECSLFDNHWCFVSKQFMTLRTIKVFLRNLIHCIYAWFGLATSHVVVFLLLSEWVREVHRRFFLYWRIVGHLLFKNSFWLEMYIYNFLSKTKTNNCIMNLTVINSISY